MSDNTTAVKKMLDVRKVMETTFNKSPQTKFLIALTIPFIIGSIFYSFVSDPKTLLYSFSTVMFLFFIMIYLLGKDYSEKWIIITSFLVPVFFWLYIFINKYRESQKSVNIGKKSFICNPSGICKTDGTIGPFNGNTDYFYKPYDKPELKSEYIPSNLFDIRISDKFTYMFWLNIDYNRWKNKKYNTDDNTVLIKGNSLDSCDLSVFIIHKDNSIQFNVNNELKVSINFPFNKWVHYAIVVNNQVVELYKNATLEKSVLLHNPINLKNTPLYIGQTPNPGLPRPNYFPGRLLFLSYNNNNLRPDEIYNIYKEEYLKISAIADDLNNNPVDPNNKPDICSNDTNNTDNNKPIVKKKSSGNLEDDIIYQKGKMINSPMDSIKKSGLLKKYNNFLSQK